jgi:hypothetical protein
MIFSCRQKHVPTSGVRPGHCHVFGMVHRGKRPSNSHSVLSKYLAYIDIVPLHLRDILEDFRQDVTCTAQVVMYRTIRKSQLGDGNLRETTTKQMKADFYQHCTFLNHE